MLLLQSRSRHAQDEIARLHIEIGYSFWLYPEWQTRMTVIPVQLYCLFLAAFASMVAPFGGFFASAIKRAASASATKATTTAAAPIVAVIRLRAHLDALAVLILVRPRPAVVAVAVAAAALVAAAAEVVLATARLGKE